MFQDMSRSRVSRRGRDQDQVSGRGLGVGFQSQIIVDVRFRDGGQGRDVVWGQVSKRGSGLVFGFRGRG